MNMYILLINSVTHSHTHTQHTNIFTYTYSAHNIFTYSAQFIFSLDSLWAPRLRRRVTCVSLRRRALSWRFDGEGGGGGIAERAILLGSPAAGVPSYICCLIPQSRTVVLRRITGQNQRSRSRSLPECLLDLVHRQLSADGCPEERQTPAAAPGW